MCFSENMCKNKGKSLENKLNLRQSLHDLTENASAFGGECRSACLQMSKRFFEKALGSLFLGGGSRIGNGILSKSHGRRERGVIVHFRGRMVQNVRMGTSCRNGYHILNSGAWVL